MVRLQPENFKFISNDYAVENLKDTGNRPTGCITLDHGESLEVKPQAMLAYKNVSLESNLTSMSLYQRILRVFFGCESLFKNTFTGKENGGWVLLEETHNHQIVEATLSDHTQGLVLCAGTHLASSPNIQLQAKYEGFSGYIKSKGFTTSLANLKPLTLEKVGKVFFASYAGPIKMIKVEKDQEVVVDNNSLVAYTEGLESSTEMAGNSLKSYFLSGEGLVTRFKGEGLIFTGSSALPMLVYSA